MDTVEGAREDSACLLTLLHRPSRLQLALPLAEKTAGRVAAALGDIREVLGADGMGRVFRAVLTDNGTEFSDERAIEMCIRDRPCSELTKEAPFARSFSHCATSGKAR